MGFLSHAQPEMLTAGLGMPNYVLFHINEGTSILFIWYYCMNSHARLFGIIARYINIHYKPYKLTECGGFFIKGIGVNYS
jgi:hypothetical protein